MSKKESGVFHFMLRWSVAHTVAAKDALVFWLSSIADKYVFQAEDTGDNPHYQGYFHLKKKNRPKTLAKTVNAEFKGIELRACSSAGKEALRAYCMKDDTRVAGPWADKEIYMGVDLWPEERFLPWQKAMMQ